MDEIERYLFDLNGFMVLRNVLSKEEAQRLLDGIPRDENGELATLEYNGHKFPSLLCAQEPLFRTLINHPTVLPYLDYLLAGKSKGPAWFGRFFLSHETMLEFEKGDRGPRFHNGGTPLDPWLQYQVQDEQIHCGLTCVVWCLTDVDEGEGGFWCLPGSHKSHFKLPREIDEYRYIPETVYQPPVRAGDAIIFTEALTHGTRWWMGDRKRVALFYKYVPGHMPLFWERPPEMLDLMTEDQKRYLQF